MAPVYINGPYLPKAIASSKRSEGYPRAVGCPSEVFVWYHYAPVGTPERLIGVRQTGQGNDPKERDPMNERGLIFPNIADVEAGDIFFVPFFPQHDACFFGPVRGKTVARISLPSTGEESLPSSAITNVSGPSSRIGAVMTAYSKGSARLQTTKASVFRQNRLSPVCGLLPSTSINQISPPYGQVSSSSTSI